MYILSYNSMFLCLNSKDFPWQMQTIGIMLEIRISRSSTNDLTFFIPFLFQSWRLLENLLIFQSNESTLFWDYLGEVFQKSQNHI